MSNEVSGLTQTACRGSTTYIFGNRTVLQLAASDLNQVCSGLADVYLTEAGKSYPPKVISTALEIWLRRQIDQISDALDALKERSESDPERSFQEILDRVLKSTSKEYAERSEDDLVFLVSKPAPAKPDEPAENIFNGYREFSFQRFAEMIDHITSESPVYKTKLNKLLFYCDFVNFSRFKSSISGATYIHLPFGPVPDEYDKILNRLADSQRITLARTRIGSSAAVTISTRWDREVPASLAEQEVGTIKWVLRNYGRLTTKEIIDISHREKAYRFTRNNEKIAYAYAKMLKHLPEKDLQG